MRKKVLGILMALVMVLCLLPAGAMAANVAKKDGQAERYNSAHMYHIDILVEAEYEYTLEFAQNNVDDHADMTLTKNWDVPTGTTLPQSVNVIVYQTVDGSTSTYKTVTLSAADNWTATLENLPLMDASGNVIEYSVTEDSVAANGFYDVVVTEVHSTLEEVSEDIMIYSEGDKDIVFHYGSDAPYMVVDGQAYTDWVSSDGIYTHTITYNHTDGRTYYSIWKYNPSTKVYTYISDDFMTVTEIDYVTYTNFDNELMVLYDRGSYVTEYDGIAAEEDGVTNSPKSYYNYIEQADTVRADQEFWSTNRAIADLPGEATDTVITVGYDYKYVYFDKFGVLTTENGTAVQVFDTSDPNWNNVCGNKNVNDTMRGYDVVLQLADAEYYHGDGSMKEYEVAVTNRLASTLSLSKTIANTTDEALLAQDFSFTITLDEAISDTFAATIGTTTTAVTFTDGVATVSLGHNDTLVISGLPVGVGYTITEQVDDGQFISSSTGEEGTIDADGSVAAFTNTYIPQYGNLRISKVLAGNGAVASDEFTVQIEISGADLLVNDTHTHHAHYVNADGSTGNGFNVTFVNGVANITIKGGETIEIIDLPVGATYEVTETSFGKYTVAYDGNKSGTIPSGGTASTTITNTRDIAPGNLTVSKTVSSFVPADAEKPFTFTVTLSDTTVSGAYGDMTFDKGVATFTLTGGESATAIGLPAGVTYKVVEAPVDGYTVSYAEGKNGEGTILEGSTVVEAITNARQTGSLMVSKTVVSDFATCKTNEYSFIIEMTGFENTGTVTFNGNVNGTETTVKFTNGRSETINLIHGQTLTLTGLPVGTEYLVAEILPENSSYEVTSTGHHGFITADTANVPLAAFTNTHKTSWLAIKKTVVSAVEADQDKVFTFKVAFSHEPGGEKPAGLELPIYVDNQQTGTVLFDENGIATVTVKAGETVYIGNVPVDANYTVTEVVEEGSDFTSTSENASGKVAATGSSAEFTNTRNTSALEIMKTVVSDLAADKTSEFTFTVTLNASEKLTGIYGDVEFKDGVATVILTDGQKVVATNLPTGIQYSVVESGNADFTIQATGTEGTITQQGATAAFTNTRKTGDLSVTKTLTAGLADDFSREYAFAVKLSDETINKVYGQMQFVNGVATFTLKSGETKYAYGLPAGVGYEVAETVPAGFVSAISNEKGTIIADQMVDVKVVNSREAGQLTITKEFGENSAINADNWPADKVILFTVEDKDGNPYGTFALPEDGEWAHTLELPVGSYIVKEAGAEVAGYTLSASVPNDGEANVTAESGAAVTYTNTYTKQQAYLVLQKIFAGDADRLTEEYKDSILFTVTGPNGYKKVIPYSLFDEEGCYYIEDALEVGSYTVTESYPVSSYTVTTSYQLNESAIPSSTVELADGDEAILTIINTYDANEDVVVRIPFSKTVKQTGTADPGVNTFYFEVANLTENSNVRISFESSTENPGYVSGIGGDKVAVTVNGADTVSGYIVLTGKLSEMPEAITMYELYSRDFDYTLAALQAAEAELKATGWTYDETAMFQDVVVDENGWLSWYQTQWFVELPQEGNKVVPVIRRTDAWDQEKSEITFTNTYSANIPVADPPQTGDDSNIALWLMLMGASAVGMTLISKRRRNC